MVQKPSLPGDWLRGVQGNLCCQGVEEGGHFCRRSAEGLSRYAILSGGLAWREPPDSKGELRDGGYGQEALLRG
eukprot:14885135-Alexandrium_andersonii.AAC.1